MTEKQSKPSWEEIRGDFISSMTADLDDEQEDYISELMRDLKLSASDLNDIIDRYETDIYSNVAVAIRAKSDVGKIVNDLNTKINSLTRVIMDIIQEKINDH